jgi:hypothetical protein
MSFLTRRIKSVDQKESHLGHFTVQGVWHAGLLTLDGKKSRLEIYADEPLHIPSKQMRRVVGISKDGVKITAVNCVGAEISGTSTYYGTTRHSISMFPNYVVFGPHHTNPEDSEINSLTFSFSHANQLFYDWGTFGHIIGERKLSFGQLREILKYVKSSPKKRRRDGRLDLYFHWDRGPIIEIKNALGTVKAVSLTSSSMPSPSGIRVKSKVMIHIDFASPCTFEAALRAQYILMLFFELVSQSRQNVEQTALTLKNTVREMPLRVYIAHDEHEQLENLHPTDVLVSGTFNSEEFEVTLNKWLETHETRGAARRRFIEGFRQGYSYDIDRLIGAANVFDLLPAADFGKATELPDEVEVLVAECEKRVNDSALKSKVILKYKDRLLDTFGRVRGLHLRTKVLSRYATLPVELTSRLPKMTDMIAHSIRARNFFVHGSPTKFSAEALYTQSPFFTDTLEFIFATSELQACGWNSKRWAKESFSRSRLKEYMFSYNEHAKIVTESLGKIP